MITLEPTWRGHPRDVLARIARGELDSLVRARARELRQLTRDSVIIEFAPEMNARFGAPWQAEGDTAMAYGYRAAWRRVVAVSRDAGLESARWLWSPSAGNPYTNQPTGGTHWNWMDRYYPGDDVVDYVGVHAFNDAESQRAWVPFVELVDGDAADRAISMLVQMHPRKPIILSELASSELPGKPGAKGAWITAAFDAMNRCAPIAAVVWFDADKERDWRVSSSAQSLAAFRAAVLSAR
jgi:beta-mannanase